MATRTPVERGLGRARLTPTAAPVDTYARSNAGSGLSQLADSLKSVAPEVARYSDVLAEQSKEKDTAAGEQKARELFESGVTYRDAIKKGLISPQDSPWFQAGAREQYGRVTAGRFATDLQDAVNKDEGLQNSTEVADYDKFVGDFRSKWMDENVGADNRGLNFEHGFGSMADGYANNSRSQFIAEAGARLVKNVGDNTYQEHFQMLDYETQHSTDPKAIASAMNLINDRVIATNPRMAKTANIAAVQALGDIVVKTGNLALFDILKDVKGGSGSLYSMKWAQDEIQKVTDKVSTDQQRKAVAQRQADDQAREDGARTLESDIISKWIGSPNPSMLDSDAQLQALNKLDPMKVQALYSLHATITGAKFNSDPAHTDRLTSQIWTYNKGQEGYVDTSTLVNAMNHRDINLQAFTYLKDMVDKRDAELEAAAKGKGEKEKNIYTDPRFRDAFSAIRSRFVSQYDSDPTKNILADRAQSELIQSWLEWANGEGKGANYEQKNKFLTAETDRITQKFGITAPVVTDVKGAANALPATDLRDKGQVQYDSAIIDVLEEQLRAGAFSPGIQRMLTANGITVDKVPAFIKAQRTLNAQHKH
jgi:hypothetical protein